MICMGIDSAGRRAGIALMRDAEAAEKMMKRQREQIPGDAVVKLYEFIRDQIEKLS